MSHKAAALKEEEHIPRGAAPQGVIEGNPRGILSSKQRKRIQITHTENLLKKKNSDFFCINNNEIITKKFSLWC